MFHLSDLNSFSHNNNNMFKSLSLLSLYFSLPVGLSFIFYIFFPKLEDEETTMNSKQNYILAAGAALTLISVPLLSYYVVHRRRSFTQLTDAGGLELLKALTSSTSSIEIIRDILARYPSSIKTVFDSHLNTPLLLALHNGKPEVAYLLLGVSSISQLDSNTIKNLEKLHRNDMRWSLLHSASYGECISFIEDLLLTCDSHFSSSTSPFLIDDADIAGWTPLVIATSKGNTNLVKLLISRGANPNTNTSQDLSPIMIASNNGYLDIVKELLLQDVDLTVQSAASLETALHMAIKNKRTEIALLLLSTASHNVSSLLSIANKTGSTPLHVAAFIGDILLVEELLRLGSDANATRGDGFTALHLTCVQNHLDIAKRLIPCTDVDSESRFGTTALHEASRRGFHKLVALLLQNGADPNKEDNDQMGPLHAVCSGVNVFNKKKEEDKEEDKQDEDINHLEVAELLIRHGANVNKLDRGGSTVLHITACGGPAGKHLMSRLLEAGVDLTLENYIGWTALHFALDFERTAKNPNPVVDIIKNFARENVPNFLETVDEMKPRAQRKLVPEGISISSEPKISLENVVSSLRAGIYQKVIVLTGAGVSVSAGIPDFRSNTGLYNSEFVKELKLASAQDVFSLPLFIQDPRPFYRLAEKVFLPVIEGDTKPTAAHWFIKLLHSKGILLRNYTQNIDGLERKAGIPPEYLVESHGTFATASCPSCHMPVPEGEGEMLTHFWSKVKNNEVPLCSRCNRAVKPDVVFFGESLPSKFFKLKLQDFKQCDLLIVMGTSLQVYPFAGLVNDVSRNVPRILLNREAVGPFVRCGHRDIALLGDCDEAVRSLVRSLGWTSDLETLSGISSTFDQTTHQEPAETNTVDITTS